MATETTDIKFRVSTRKSKHFHFFTPLHFSRRVGLHEELIILSIDFLLFFTKRYDFLVISLILIVYYGGIEHLFLD